jgi:hypothetical protein
MRRYLLESLRIDAENLGKLNADTIIILAERYRSRKLRLLSDVVSRFREEGERHE